MHLGQYFDGTDFIRRFDIRQIQFGARDAVQFFGGPREIRLDLRWTATIGTGSASQSVSYRQLLWLTEGTSAALFVHEQRDSFPRIPSVQLQHRLFGLPSC